MAYVAVSGGEEAIATSIQLLDYYRSGTEKDLELEAIAREVQPFGGQGDERVRTLCKAVCGAGAQTV